MSALICGSLAYDTIMVFPDQFKNHILPDKVHILNVSFLVPRMRREFGGCAGNIAYNLKLLGGDPIPLATVGADSGPYREHFQGLGIAQADGELPAAFDRVGEDFGVQAVKFAGALEFAHSVLIIVQDDDVHGAIQCQPCIVQRLEAAACAKGRSGRVTLTLPA